MSFGEAFGFCGLIVGVVAFGAKVGVEAEPVDVLALIGCSLAVGYFGRLL